MRRRVVRICSSISSLVLSIFLSTSLANRAAAVTLHASVRVDPARFGLEIAAWQSSHAASPIAAPHPARYGVSVVIPPGDVVRHVVAQVRASQAYPATDLQAGSDLHAEVAGVGAWLGYSIAFVQLEPLVRGMHGNELATEIDLVLDTTPGGTLPLARLRANANRDATERATVESAVVNPDDVGRFAPAAGQRIAAGRGFQPTALPDLEGSDVDYVIVTSAALAPAFQPLADWKTRRGVPAVVRSIESIQASYPNGSDVQETIRTFLKDAYTKWGATWVLLGGDTDVIPARFLVSSFAVSTPQEIPCDLYFAGLDGNWNADGDFVYGEAAANTSLPDPDQADLLAELYTARLPVVNATQVAAFTAKVIAYETPFDPTYQDRALFLGEVLFPTNWDSSQAITMDGAQLSEDMITQRFPPSMSVKRRYEDFTSFPAALPLSRTASLTDLQDGFNIVNHIGHGFRYNMSVGDASIVNSDADALVSPNRFSVLNILNCTSLAFDYSCLGEHFINDVGGGAVAVAGASRSAYPLPAREYQDDWYDLFFNQGVWHLGELFARSRLNQTPLAAAESAHRWSHYIYNLLGDPEMNVYSGLPVAVSVSQPASVGLGPANISITVTGPGAQPVAAARVCLQKGLEDYQVGTTNASGVVVLPFTSESPGSIDVTVSGRNLRTWQSSLPVNGSPAASYLHLQSVAIDDDNSGGTSGNADTAPDAGETLDLRFTLRNDGGAASGAVTGTISCADPYVTILTPGWSSAAVAAAGTTIATTTARIRLLATGPDHHVFDLVVTMNGGGGPTTDHWKREIHAPALQLVRLEVLDGVTGNGNGEPDEGETFELKCWIKNYGSGRLDGATGVLQTSSPNVTILQGTSPYVAIAPLATVAQTVSYQLIEDFLATNQINLRITDTRGRLVVKRFELRRPTAPLGVLLDPSTGPTVILATWPPVSDPDLAGYHVYRAPAASGPWTRATVDATKRTSYFRDTGLATNTRYYYAITAVDSSGNESPQSPNSAVSTNPPQITGWPIAMAAETSSSPALGDLDGDGGLEIVQGDSKVYAWHGNGQEVTDADHDAQTWGVFSTAAGITNASVVLAEIDATPGLEVFSCNWDNNTVLALNGDGQVLWSRSPANGGQPGYWGTPAAADVDRDGHVELFAASKDGRLYAWHHDGSPLLASHADGFFASIAGYSRSSPAIGDLDGDFQLEIAMTDVAGNLYAWKPDGTSLAGFPKAYGVAFYNSPVIGDVDGDGRQEIVAIHQSGSNNLHCLRGDGSELDGFPITVTLKSSSLSPTPALADLDDDGKLEIVVGSNEYAPSDSKLYVYRYNGSLYPGWPQPTFTDSESSPIVADLDGDSHPDIVFGGQDGVLRGWKRDGTELLGFPLSVGDFIRGTPAVGDVDGDGGVDLVLAAWDRNLYIWDFPAPWHPNQAQWPTFLHDASRTAAYGYTVHDATDAGPGQFESPPARLELAQNRPNPFNPVTTIAFGLPTGGARVQLDVYDVRGHHVRGLIDARLAAGRHRVDWDGRDDRRQSQPSGVYFYRLRCNGVAETHRMVLLK